MIFQWPPGTWETLSFSLQLDTIIIVPKLFSCTAIQINTDGSSGSPTTMDLLLSLRTVVTCQKGWTGTLCLWTVCLFSGQCFAPPLTPCLGQFCAKQQEQGAKNVPAWGSPFCTSLVSALPLLGRCPHLRLALRHCATHGNVPRGGGPTPPQHCYHVIVPFLITK